MLGTYLNMQEIDVDTLGHSQEKVKCVPKLIPVATSKTISCYVMNYFYHSSFVSRPFGIICMLYRYKGRNINV